jgi:glycosyltransferase involved in cell wall biosynthesis
MVSIKKPRISILMPVFNGERFVRSSVESIISQSFSDWELIVMDGGSSDGTGNIFMEYTEKYPNIHFYSEPDEGAWHAIYKASKLAGGEFLAIMCVSDGYLNKDWLRLCVEKFDEDRTVSLVWGVPFQMDEKGELLGPNYLYARFLKDPGEYRRRFLLQMLSKFNPRYPRHILGLFKKLNPENIGTVRNIFKGGNVSQKEDWFFYWLKTGQFFPDLNMCMYKEVFFDCVPPYISGHKVVDEYMTFYFNFNTKGYLAYCIPVPANYGRVHRGQYTDKVISENERMRREYFKKIRKFRDELVPGHSVQFIDHTKNNISSRIIPKGP